MSFLPFDEINLLEIEVSEKIEEKNLKKFIFNNFKLNNLDFLNHKIYINHITQLNLYQIILLPKKFKYFEFQVFEQFYSNQDFSKDCYDLYLFKNHMVLYKNGAFYYFQNFTISINIDEFLILIGEKFKIEISNFRQINDESFESLKKEYLKKDIRSKLKFFNTKSNYSFVYYLLYIVLLVFLLSYSLTFKKEEKKVEDSSSQMEKLIKEHQFLSLKSKIEPIFKLLKEFQVDLKNFEYDNSHLKIVLESNTKDNIFLFLEKNKNIILSSSINYLENSKTFQAVINVQLSK